MSIAVWAAPRARSSLEPFNYKAASLAPKGMEIRISHCRICHSDLHLINDDWGSSRYPLVPRHENIGMVIQASLGAHHLKPGQRVRVAGNQTRYRMVRVNPA